MTKIKLLFIAGMQLLVVCMLWIVVILERLLTSALVRISDYMLSPRSFKVLERIVESRPETSSAIQREIDNTVDSETAVKNILYTLNLLCNNPSLDKNRKTFEDTVVGRRAMGYKQILDGHLYAVLRPTRAENLKRIENVLRSMDPEALQRVNLEASKTLRFIG